MSRRPSRLFCLPSWVLTLLSPLVLLPSASAGEFFKAFEAALENDATYQAARAELASSQQNLPIAKAGLRPTLTLSISDSKVDGNRTIDTPPFPATQTPLDYRAPAQSLNLRAPLFNREAAKRIETAQVQERYAQAVFAARQLELLERLARSWVDMVLSDDNLAQARQQVAVAQTQLTLAQRRLAMGEGTRLEVSDADSALALVQVQASDILAQRELAQLALRQMTGTASPPASGSVALDRAAQPPGTSLPQAPATLANSGNIAALPGNLAQLQAQAETNSPNIRARRHAVDVASLAIERARSGHYPRLDFVASITQSSNETLSTVNQSAYQQSYGLQLNVPLYAGGSVNAAITQAHADLNRAQAELAAEEQTVARDVARFYLAAEQTRAKWAAQNRAVDSAKLALEAASKGAVAGFASKADIAQAERKLAQTMTERTQSVQELLLAHTRLVARTAGDATEAARQIDTLLARLLS